MVGVAGFEPATPCSQSRCATTALHPDVGDSRGRTHLELDSRRAPRDSTTPRRPGNLCR